MHLGFTMPELLWSRAESTEVAFSGAIRTHHQRGHRDEWQARLHGSFIHVPLRRGLRLVPQCPSVCPWVIVPQPPLGGVSTTQEDNTYAYKQGPPRVYRGSP